MYCIYIAEKKSLLLLVWHPYYRYFLYCIYIAELIMIFIASLAGNYILYCIYIEEKNIIASLTQRLYYILFALYLYHRKKNLNFYCSFGSKLYFCTAFILQKKSIIASSQYKFHFFCCFGKHWNPWLELHSFIADFFQLSDLYTAFEIFFYGIEWCRSILQNCHFLLYFFPWI